MVLATATTADAPAAIGPYRQAIITDSLVFCSGQLPLDPGTGDLIDGDIYAQTTRALANLAAVLKAAGTSVNNVVRTTLYLVDLADFGEVNRAYEESFGPHRPARVTVEVSGLPKAARIEIECVAVR